LESDDDSDSGSGLVSSEETAGPKRQTRKLAKKSEADAILSTDEATSEFHGFSVQESIPQDDSGQNLKQLLEDDDNISVCSVSSADLDEPGEFVYLSDVEDADSLAEELGKKFDVAPIVNMNPPLWLQNQLSYWALRREDVELLWAWPKGVPRRGITTEEKFNGLVERKRKLEAAAETKEQPPIKKAAIEATSVVPQPEVEQEPEAKQKPDAEKEPEAEQKPAEVKLEEAAAAPSCDEQMPSDKEEIVSEETGSRDIQLLYRRYSAPAQHTTVSKR